MVKFDFLFHHYTSFGKTLGKNVKETPLKNKIKDFVIYYLKNWVAKDSNTCHIQTLFVNN